MLFLQSSPQSAFKRLNSDGTQTLEAREGQFLLGLLVLGEWGRCRARTRPPSRNSRGPFPFKMSSSCTSRDL